MNVSSREQWIEFAGGPDEAAKYESLFLQADRGPLPERVRQALDNPWHEPGPDYWAFLAEQWLDHMWPPSPRVFSTPPPTSLVKGRGLLGRLGIKILRRRRPAASATAR
jgi:hypothetical protein